MCSGLGASTSATSLDAARAPTDRLPPALPAPASVEGRTGLLIPPNLRGAALRAPAFRRFAPCDTGEAARDLRAAPLGRPLLPALPRLFARFVADLAIF